MKYISIIFVFIFIVSCSSDETKNAVFISGGVEFNVLDIQGNDLLNPQIESNFNNTENIKIYFVINGEAVLFDKPNLDLPKGYLIYKKENEDVYRMGLFVNLEGNTTTTLIKWNNTETDTIKCEIERKGNYYISVSKVWYNNVLKYDGDGEIYFEIVK